MLKLENVFAGYSGTTALHGFTLQVPEGEIVSILGRNGVGKTSMLRAIIGEIPTSSGEISLNGNSINHLKTHERARIGISYVPQGRDIFPSLSVLDNLRAAAYGSKKFTWKKELAELFSDFPILFEKRNDKGSSLSGGQQQILAIARGLISSPKVLLLDEPSEGIQPSIVSQIADIIRNIQDTRKITMLLVEQNLDFAAKVAERACIVDKGAVVHDVSIREIIADKEIQKKLLGV